MAKYIIETTNHNGDKGVENKLFTLSEAELWVKDFIATNPVGRADIYRLGPKVGYAKNEYNLFRHEAWYEGGDDETTNQSVQEVRK